MLKEIKRIENLFVITPNQMTKLITSFQSEMKKGLRGCNSSLKMLPSHVGRPRGKEKGTFLALDLGGTNFRVFTLTLKGKRKLSIQSSGKFVLKKEHMTGKGIVLFDFIADRIKVFMQENKIDLHKRQAIGFTFSFPVKMKGIASGILLRWTKGFRASGVEGKDVVKLLNEALIRKRAPKTKVVALANDTVSTFVAKSYEDPHCDMGVILGTGTNACYSEKVANIKKRKGKKTKSHETVINIEWGNFNKLPLTPYDRKLDKLSRNPGEQLLEKMVSGMYLGKLTGLVLKNLKFFHTRDEFKSEYLSIIEGDKSKDLSGTKALLQKIGIRHSKYADRKLLKKICRIVSTRAAYLSAVAIASVITKLDPTLRKKHTIAIDGSVYEKHPRFSLRMKRALREIFRKKAKNIKLSLTKDASAKGAAIMAAMTEV